MEKKINTQKQFIISRLIIAIGLLFIFFGLLNIKNKASYVIKNWLREINTIKSKLAFWTFCISIVNILPFFILAYFFSPISKKVFLGLPLFVMIYSILVVVLSLSRKPSLAV